MTNLTREQKLCNILEAEENYHRIGSIENVLYRRNKVRLGSVLRGLAGLSETRGVHAYFILHDPQAMRRNFHVASKLTLTSADQDGGESFQLAFAFLYGLLSDNEVVIHALAHAESPELRAERDNPMAVRFHVHMLQLAIKGEHEALRAKIDILAKRGKKSERDAFATGQDFYSLLLNRDKGGLERLIQDKHARIKSFDPGIENFMSYLGTLEAKLCWFKGIPVQIESPWVPMELMPVQPLTHYDDEYEFLKPGWVPPPQGLLGKVSRWFKFD